MGDGDARDAREGERTMRQTIMTCDRCHNVIPEHEVNIGQVWEVQVSIRSASGPHLSNSPLRVRAEEWCRPCVIARLGMLSEPTSDPLAPDAPAKLTLDDLVREIIREEVTS
jgi:hypothetical protein